MAVEANPLVARVRDAAAQLRFMQPWLEDRSFEIHGGRIIYAVDADVFSIYGASHLDQGVRLGRVFFDDNADLSAALAQRLTDHIFFRITNDKPLLVVPPIEEEVASILQALIREFGNVPPDFTVDSQKLHANIERLRSTGASTLDHDAIYNLVLKFIYLQTGHAATYRALARLIALDRIAGPEAVAKANRDIAPLNRVFQPFRTLKQIFDHLELRQVWFEHLTENRSMGERKRENLERDAECLARIEIWNRELEESKVRILYITGAPYIYDAMLRNRSQAHSFIRHPRYFLASVNVFRDLRSPDLPSAESAFLGWLRTLVGGFSNVERFDKERPFDLSVDFAAAIIRASEQKPETSMQIQDRWADFTREFREAYRPPRLVRERIVEEVGTQLSGVKTIQEWENLRDHLDSQIREMTTKAWDACFFIATRAGFAVGSESPGRPRTPARTVPPIYFDSWPKTRAFIRMVSRWHGPGDFDQSLYDNGILDVQAEDQSGYAYYLAHAALFSGRGEWRTAAAICDQAIAVAPGLADPAGGQANGREAHYLAAFSRRHAVRDREELDPLRLYVQRAKEIYRQEQKTRPALDAVGERFESEELAIEVTRLMFDRYAPRSPEVSLTNLVGVAERLLRDLLELRNRLTERILVLSANSGDLEMQRRRETARQLLARISANVISLSLAFFEGRSAEKPGFAEAYSFLAEYVASGDEDGSELGRSFFIGSVLMAAGSLLKTVKLRKRDVENHFLNSEASSVFSYDRVRFAHWEKIALAAI